MDFINTRAGRFLLLASLVVPLLVIAASVKAQTVGSSNAEDAPDNRQNTTLAQRLVQREATYKNQLSGQPREKITEHCQAAQAKVSEFKEKSFALADKRQEVYSRVSSHIARIVKYLNEHQIDTVNITAAQSKFDESLKVYSAGLVQYKSAIDDLLSLGCAADPTGFYASLLDARSLWGQLASASASVKNEAPALAGALKAAHEALTNAAHSGGGEH